MSRVEEGRAWDRECFMNQRWLAAVFRWACNHKRPTGRDHNPGGGGADRCVRSAGPASEDNRGEGQTNDLDRPGPAAGSGFESHPAPATRLACARCVSPKNHAAISPSPRGRRPREWSKREWSERSGEWRRQHEKSGDFALTPALSRGRGGCVWRESIRGRGGTRGCRRWGVIGKEPSTGRALAWIGSFSTPWGEQVPAGGMRG